MDCCLILDGTAFLLKEKVCCLTVILGMAFNCQVLAMAKSTISQLWLIHQLHSFPEWTDLAKASQALVVSRLDDGDVLYLNCPQRLPGSF